jgi:Na+-transporting methylmalonyl-CoA/oxaloacetate decarboxylase gamma subunit
MISDEVKMLLIEVITSWQVIGVTVVLVLYLSLVFYVARFHQRRKKVAMLPKAKPKPKKEKKAPVEEEEEDTEPA